MTQQFRIAKPAPDDRPDLDAVARRLKEGVPRLPFSACAAAAYVWLCAGERPGRVSITLPGLAKRFNASARSASRWLDALVDAGVVAERLTVAGRGVDVVIKDIFSFVEPSAIRVVVDPDGDQKKLSFDDTDDPGNHGGPQTQCPDIDPGDPGHNVRTFCPGSARPIPFSGFNKLNPLPSVAIEGGAALETGEEEDWKEIKKSGADFFWNFWRAGGLIYGFILVTLRSVTQTKETRT